MQVRPDGWVFTDIPRLNFPIVFRAKIRKQYFVKTLRLLRWHWLIIKNWIYVPPTSEPLRLRGGRRMESKAKPKSESKY